MLKEKMQSFRKLNKAYSNQGVSIIMVIIAMSFVGILVSIVMLAALYNFYMKGVDKKSKDNFYSAETALEEVRGGIQRTVSDVFAASYMSILTDYGRSDTGRDERFAQMYTDDLFMRLGSSSDPDCYDEAALRNFISQCRVRYESDEKGAWLKTDENIQKSLQRYTDGIRLKGLQVSYIDEDGYMSIINTDFLIKIPDLNLGRPGDVPDILNYCLIANQHLTVVESRHPVLEGSVYGGQEGIDLKQGSSLEFARASFQDGEYAKSSSIFVSTDGDINVGKQDAVVENGSLATLKMTRTDGKAGVSLWASGINLYGGASNVNNPNCDLNGDVYLRDDFTIAGDSNVVKLAGNFYGYGNDDSDVAKSSSIVINGTNTKLDFEKLNNLELAGNGFISIEVPDDSTQNRTIKTGNSATSKAEQLAYLIPAELVGIVRKDDGSVDEENSLKKNPIPYSEYENFKEMEKTDKERNQMVDFSLGNGLLREPLVNYGIDEVESKKPAFYQRNGGSVWVYFYFKFHSALNANRFFQDYYNRNKQYLSNYIKNYISDFKIDDTGNTGLYLAGNMVVKKGDSYELVSATEAPTDEVNAKNTKFAELGLKFDALTHTLSDNAYALSDTQRKNSVFDNLIDVAKFRSMIPSGDRGVYFKGDVQDGNVTEAEQNLAVLINKENGAGTFVLDNVFLNDPDHKHIHLLIVDGNVEVTATEKFEGIIIASGTVTIRSDAKISAYANTYNKMANCFLAVAKKGELSGSETDHAAVYFFKQGKEAIEEDDEEGSGDSDDNQTITASDLIVPENWVKY